MDENIARRLILNIGDAIRIAYNGQSKVKCPYCQVEKELPILPLTPIVICVCTECDNCVIPFAGELLPFPKGVVVNGTDEDRRWAIVQAIMKMLHEKIQGLVKYKIPPPEDNLEIPDSI